MNDFTGQLCIDGKERLLVSEDNMLLRGCQLRNTEWVVGLVLACGTESKINFKGGKGADKAKSGTTMVMVNQNIIGVVLCLLLVCAISSSLGIAWQGAYDAGEPWYLDPEAAVGGKEALGVSAGKWFQAWGTYFLLLYQFIPVSLYVSMNMIWTISRYFMQKDLEMYDGAQDEPCRVRSMGLIDELGQVSHIFSDKTGTLTSNLMVFRRVMIGGSVYGCGDTAISRSLRVEGARNVRPPMHAAPLPPFATVRECAKPYVNFDEAVGSPILMDDICDPELA